jgi:hypothetical protein
MGIKGRLIDKTRSKDALFQARMDAGLYKRLTKELKKRKTFRWEFLEAAAKELLGEK